MDVDSGWEDMDHEENAGLYTLPPGEEGIFHSHAGGETVFQQIIADIDPRYVVIFSSSTLQNLSILSPGNEAIHVHAIIVYKSALIPGAGSYHGWLMHISHGDTAAFALQPLRHHQLRTSLLSIRPGISWLLISTVSCVCAFQILCLSQFERLHATQLCPLF